MPSSDADLVMRLEFEMSTDEITNSRSVYTFFDFLGDVGGLLDMLIIFAKLISSFASAVSGSAIHVFMIKRLFYRSSSRDQKQTEVADTFDDLQTQKVLKTIK